MIDIRKLASVANFPPADHPWWNENEKLIQAFADAILDSALYAAANQRGPAAGFNGVSRNHGIDKAIEAIRALKSQ